ncbi:MAG: hypothetical protein IJ689_02420 [Alphaproteobacteria bacterium]|nr:hypothetical protein [Alphaproteobacteria bacterium]
MAICCLVTTFALVINCAKVLKKYGSNPLYADSWRYFEYFIAIVFAVSFLGIVPEALLNAVIFVYFLALLVVYLRYSNNLWRLLIALAVAVIWYGVGADNVICLILGAVILLARAVSIMRE